MWNIYNSSYHIFLITIYNKCINHKLLSFFIEKAGPNHLNILDKIIDVTDQLELTPLYQLCEQGFDKKSGEPNADRREMLKLLIEGDEAIKKLPAKSRRANTARWDIQANRLGYSPMHWLACLNDVESIQYLLGLVKYDR